MRTLLCNKKSVSKIILGAISLIGLAGMAAGPMLSSENQNHDFATFEALSAGLLLASAGLLIYKKVSSAVVSFLTISSILMLVGGLTAQEGLKAIIEPFVLGGTVVIGPYFVGCYFKNQGHV